MPYGVHLEVAGFPFVPGEIGSDGYLVFQERPKFGVAFAFEGKFFSVRGKSAVDGGSAYGYELGLDVLSDEGPEGLVS